MFLSVYRGPIRMETDNEVPSYSYRDRPSPSKSAARRERHRLRRRTREPSTTGQPRRSQAPTCATSDGNKITTAAVGTLVYVKAEFKAQDLPASAAYRPPVHARRLGPHERPDHLGAGIAGTSNWVGVLGNWVVKPGPHTATVTLDATNTGRRDQWRR